MYTFEDVRLEKLTHQFLGMLESLKNESWFGTHSVSFVNSEKQEVWFDSLNKEDVICPKNLVMIARGVERYKEAYVFGVFKITNIHWPNRSADVAWDVFSHSRGKKLGKPLVLAGVAFCFEMLNLRRLNAEILETNVPSRKCAEAAGFVFEGTKREAIMRQGRLIDSNVFSILDREWFNYNEKTTNPLLETKP